MELGRWKRISRTDTRVWNVIKYGCRLSNKQMGEKVFHVKETRLEQEDVKELVEEAVDKVMSLPKTIEMMKGRKKSF